MSVEQKDLIISILKLFNYVGSGVETISHIRENGRVTIMFSAFEGPPRILRLYGIGTSRGSLASVNFALI